MKVKKVYELEGIPFTGGTSFRPFLKADGMGFSVCRTEVQKGGPYIWHYKHHIEACYCIKGVGILRNLDTGEEHHIAKDMIYAVDQHERHSFEALTDVTLLSIFNPPLTGKETHDKNGVYS